MKGICFCPATWERIRKLLNKTKTGKQVIRIINAAQTNRKPATKKRKTTKKVGPKAAKRTKSNGRSKKASPAQMRVRNNMKRAAKKCKGLKGAKHKACMKRELKKKR